MTRNFNISRVHPLLSMRVRMGLLSSKPMPQVEQITGPDGKVDQFANSNDPAFKEKHSAWMSSVKAALTDALLKFGLRDATAEEIDALEGSEADKLANSIYAASYATEPGVAAAAAAADPLLMESIATAAWLQMTVDEFFSKDVDFQCLLVASRRKAMQR